MRTELGLALDRLPEGATLTGPGKLPSRQKAIVCDRAIDSARRSARMALTIHVRLDASSTVVVGKRDKTPRL